MLLTGYTNNITSPTCNTAFTSLHCISDLHDDVSEAIPYINATLGGYNFVREPISISFKMYGKLLTVHSKKVAINALKDADEAEAIMKWLQNEINQAWENRASIEPQYEDPPKPEMLKILKYLPKTNCKECGLPTCMVFATRTAEGLKDANNCPPLKNELKEELTKYLSGFTFEE